MNKKGFTLIEIIGVVTVLSLILIVAIPSLTKTVKRNSQNKYNDYIDNIKIAAENYVVDKLKEGSFIEEGKDTNYISLGKLMDVGYVENAVSNPKNNKTLSRDTRIKVQKQPDNTYSYEIQEYYNRTSDYCNEDLIIHYDSVEYSPNNIFKNHTSEIDYNYSTKGTWTEDGVLLEKNKTGSKTNLNQIHETDSITISYSLKSLDELGSDSKSYSYPVMLYQNGNFAARTAFRKEVALFYDSGQFAVFNTGKPFSINQNYTITFVQDGLTSRKIYVNGVLTDEENSTTATAIKYNSILISPEIYDFKVNNILVYNRALTNEEIEELYELDKERFGE